MSFENWMIHRGLSISSVKKYSGAIQGPLSEWALSSELTAGPLTALTNPSIFGEVAHRISALPVFLERNVRGHHMYSSALAKFAEYLAEGFEGDIESDLDSIIDDTDLSRTEILSLVKARIGQGVFRQKVVGYWKACAVTGFKDTNLLVASHIKPWRVSNSAERLNPCNGLLLSPNLDRVFDAGLITFDARGRISLSPLLTEPEKMGVVSNLSVKLSEMHEPFMAYHRDVVYRAN